MTSMDKPILRWRGGRIVGTAAASATHYEGAAIAGPRVRTWHAPGSGPNRALTGSLQTLRNRSREQVRNNPWLWKAIESLVANEVGVGVSLRSNAPDEAMREQIDAIWRAARNQLDPAGQLNWGGIQEQAVRARREGGGVFLRRRWLSDASMQERGLSLPFQVQVLEPEFCPHTYNATLPSGNEIRGGIEYNLRGWRVAYWLYPSHPADTLGFARGGVGLVRVRAADIIHHYLAARPGQDHGEPALSRALLPGRTFDSYADAELRRKESRAAYTGAIEREPAGDGYAHGSPNAADDALEVDAGSFVELRPGEKINLFDGDPNSAGYWEFARGALMQIAAGAAGVPYELMTGDWEKVNDRLVRSILNEYRRSLEMAQDHLLIFQLCGGVWSWSVDAMVLRGLINPTDYATTRAQVQHFIARPHRWPYVHPQQDIAAATMAIDAGLSSRTDEADKRPGPPIEDIDRQRKADADRAAALGLDGAADD